MFRLSPVKLWRSISAALCLTAMLFALIGTAAVRGDLIIHWDSEGSPNGSTGKWVLWAMLLLAFLSMFTHSSLSAKRPGNHPMSMEMAGAVSSGMVATWTILDIVLVAYHFCPCAAVPAVGTAAVVLCYGLFAVIARLRERKARGGPPHAARDFICDK